MLVHLRYFSATGNTARAMAIAAEELAAAGHRVDCREFNEASLPGMARPDLRRPFRRPDDSSGFRDSAWTPRDPLSGRGEDARWSAFLFSKLDPEIPPLSCPRLRAPIDPGAKGMRSQGHLGEVDLAPALVGGVVAHPEPASLPYHAGVTAISATGKLENGTI